MHKKLILLATILFLINNNCSAQHKIGDTIIDIIGTNKNGLLQSTVAYHKGLLLVDFWASWCRPCRRYGIPWVNQMFNSYSSKGLQVFSISLDNDVNAWQKTIITDSCKGVHVYDAAAWKAKSVKQYHINSIPSKLLFYNGVLIMANTSMAEMEAEILKHLQ